MLLGEESGELRLPKTLTSWRLEDVFLASKEVGRVGSALGPWLPLACALSLHPDQEAGLLSALWFLPLLRLLLCSARKPVLFFPHPQHLPGTGM